MTNNFLLLARAYLKLAELSMSIQYSGSLYHELLGTSADSMRASRFLVTYIKDLTFLPPTASKSPPWNFRSSWVLLPFMWVSELRLDTQFDNGGDDFSRKLNVATCLDLQTKGELSVLQT